MMGGKSASHSGTPLEKTVSYEEGLLGDFEFGKTKSVVGCGWEGSFPLSGLMREIWSADFFFCWSNDAECSKVRVWTELEITFKHLGLSVTFAWHFLWRKWLFPSLIGPFADMCLSVKCFIARAPLFVSELLFSISLLCYKVFWLWKQCSAVP